MMIAAALLTLSAPAAASDEVAAYLEQHGLIELLAVHLESQAEETEGDRRTELLVRLAGIYAQLLETVEDPAPELNVPPLQ